MLTHLPGRRELMPDGFADLFAPDAVMEFAFRGPPGTPVRVQGREAIREYAGKLNGIRS
jgi:hypothetical protein